MWPWEHVVVGYLAYSLFCRAYYRESPDGSETVAVVLAALLPDIIDKPLGWEFGITASAYSLGHSVFFTLPLVLAVGMLGRAVSRPRTVIAFGIGYLLHAPGDILFQYRGDGNLHFEIVLWPLVTWKEIPASRGLLTETLTRFTQYRAELVTGELSLYASAQVVLALLVFVLWLWDGAPVLSESIAGTERVLAGLADRLG